jgi:hypothetical protein
VGARPRQASTTSVGCARGHGRLLGAAGARGRHGRLLGATAAAVGGDLARVATVGGDPAGPQRWVEIWRGRRQHVVAKTLC